MATATCSPTCKMAQILWSVVELGKDPESEKIRY